MTARTQSLQQRVRDFLDRDLWNAERSARRLLQFIVVVAQGCSKDLVLLRASALTYYSILALIPLLAIGLSVVEALGVSEDLAGVIVDRLAVGNPEAGARILELVERVEFGRLGTLGAGVLFITSVLGISSIERSLNTIWGVNRERPWERRLPDYLAVLIVAPILLGIALSLGTTLRSQAMVGWLLENPAFEAFYRTGLRQAPLVFLWLGFAFLYWFLPNTRVRIGSALVGGAVGAVLFTLAQRVYVDFNVGVQRYNVLFGGFAFLPLLLVWIYISWVLLLFGAEVAFAHQNLGRVREARRGEEPGPAAREAFGVAIAVCVARAFRDGEGAVDAETLAQRLDLPVRTVRELTVRLEEVGILATRGDGQEGFQLARAAERIPVTAVMGALRGPGPGRDRIARAGAALTDLLAEAERRSAETLGGRTLADLLDPPEATG